MWGEQSTDFKSLLFEIYAAGFEAGMQKQTSTDVPKTDIVTAYNQYFKKTIQPTLDALAEAKRNGF